MENDYIPIPFSEVRAGDQSKLGTRWLTWEKMRGGTLFVVLDDMCILTKDWLCSLDLESRRPAAKPEPNETSEPVWLDSPDSAGFWWTSLRGAAPILRSFDLCDVTVWSIIKGIKSGYRFTKAVAPEPPRAE